MNLKPQGGAQPPTPGLLGNEPFLVRPGNIDGSTSPAIGTSRPWAKHVLPAFPFPPVHGDRLGMEQTEGSIRYSQLGTQDPAGCVGTQEKVWV